MNIFLVPDKAKSTWRYLDREKFIIFTYHLLHLFVMNNRDVILNPFTNQFIIKSITYFPQAFYRYSVLKLLFNNIVLESENILKYVSLINDNTYSNLIIHCALKHINEHYPADADLASKLFRMIKKEDLLNLEEKYHNILWLSIYHKYDIQDDEFNLKLFKRLKITRKNDTLIKMISFLQLDQNKLLLCEHFVANKILINVPGALKSLQHDEFKIKFCKTIQCPDNLTFRKLLHSTRNESDTVKLQILIYHVKYLNYDDIFLLNSFNCKKELLRHIYEHLTSLGINYRFKSGIEVNSLMMYNFYSKLLLEQEDDETKEELSDKKICSVCLINKKKVCLNYCGHKCMCCSCANDIFNIPKPFTCPLCYAYNNSFSVIF